MEWTEHPEAMQRPRSRLFAQMIGLTREHCAIMGYATPEQLPAPTPAPCRKSPSSLESGRHAVKLIREMIDDNHDSSSTRYHEFGDQEIDALGVAIAFIEVTCDEIERRREQAGSNRVETD